MFGFITFRFCESLGREKTCWEAQHQLLQFFSNRLITAWKFLCSIQSFFPLEGCHQSLWKCSEMLFVFKQNVITKKGKINIDTNKNAFLTQSFVKAFRFVRFCQMKSKIKYLKFHTNNKTFTLSVKILTLLQRHYANFVSLQ